MNTYTVKFYNNAAKTKLLWSETVQYGNTVSKTIPAISGLTSDTWRQISGSNAYGQPITGNNEYSASYKYTWSGGITVGSSNQYAYMTNVLYSGDIVNPWFDVGDDNTGFVVTLKRFTGTLKHGATPNHHIGFILMIGLKNESTAGSIVIHHNFIREPIQTVSNETMTFDYNDGSKTVTWNNYSSTTYSLINSKSTDQLGDSKMIIRAIAEKDDGCSVTWNIECTNCIFEFT